MENVPCLKHFAPQCILLIWGVGTRKATERSLQLPIMTLQGCCCRYPDGCSSYLLALSMESDIENWMNEWCHYGTWNAIHFARGHKTRTSVKMSVIIDAYHFPREATSWERFVKNFLRASLEISGCEITGAEITVPRTGTMGHTKCTHRKGLLDRKNSSCLITIECLKSKQLFHVAKTPWWNGFHIHIVMECFPVRSCFFCSPE